MGTYVTYDEVIKRYQAIKKAYENPTECEADLIAYAEDMLNGLLGKCMSTPLPVISQVKDMVIDLCYYKHLYTKDPERAALIREAIIGRVEGICKGDEVLHDADGNAIDLSGAGQTVWSNTMDYQPTFSMLDASNPASHVDSNMQADEESARR